MRSSCEDIYCEEDIDQSELVRICFGWAGMTSTAYAEQRGAHRPTILTHCHG